MTSFATRTKLLDYQQDAAAKLLPARVGALFMDMGTGKTRTAIELIRLRQSKIDHVVWFCPMSLKQTITHEILKHTNCRPESIYSFDGRTTERTVPQDAFWYVIGVESMSVSARVILTSRQLITERTFVVLDESSYIKGPRARRTQYITDASQPARYRLALTGTPISQGVVDLYSQMYFLSPKILGYSSFYSFARNHLEYSDKYPGLIVRAHNLDHLAAKIKPYVYQVTKDEVDLRLPRKLYETYSCGLTGEQAEAYRQAKAELLDEVDTDNWDSLFIFRLFAALQGIIVGFWRRPKGELVTLPHGRISLLLSVLEQIPAPEKVIIWAKYRYSAAQIRDALTEAYGAEAVAEFQGELTESQRNHELDRWRQSARFLIATQGAGGHGLTLNEAHYVVFYANSFKYAERLQAEDRCHRIGQERRPTYIDLDAGTGIERRIFKALRRKGDALAEFRRQVERVKQSNKKRLRQLVQTL